MDRRIATLALALALAASATAAAQDLANEAFQLRYDEGGIRSLRRTRDVHDTDYIAPNAALGPLLLRYRTTANGDWRELRDILLKPPASERRSLEYALGSRLPTLASRSSPSAERGVGGLRALSDGLVPAALGGGGRGRGAPPAGPPATLPGQVPVFTWTAGPNEPGAGGTGEAGVTRWVQYTFPVEEEVSRTEVFWVTPPRSWRLLYQDGPRWTEVQARTPYGTTAGVFTAIEFAPVKTLALRVEVALPQGGTASLAEWRVGPPPELAPTTDLAVTGSFVLDGDVLDWTITLANRASARVEVGDLGVPLPFAERTGARGDIYTKKLLRHALVAGHGSWVYWQRSNGAGPYFPAATCLLFENS